MKKKTRNELKGYSLVTFYLIEIVTMTASLYWIGRLIYLNYGVIQSFHLQNIAIIKMCNSILIYLWATYMKSLIK